MTAHERRAWLVVATLFITLLFVFGAAFFTAGIFFTPLIRQFGWSRAELSAVTSALLVTTGLSAPVFGWILDRVDARVLMTAGVTLSGVAFVGASRIHTFAALFICYVLLGLGVGASSLLPATFVVANWFETGRGLAMGITTAGTSVGGMVMTLAANSAIRFGGWRFGFVLLALPMFVIVIPLVALTLRSRPAGRDPRNVHGNNDLPGLEVGPALGTRSFWMLSIGQFCFGYVGPGAVLHLVPYLIGIGYSLDAGALALSLMLGFISVGKLLFGWIGDQLTGRASLGLDFITATVGLILLLAARHPVALWAMVPILGCAVGSPVALMPMVTAESLGLKRLGSLIGLTNLPYTIGAALGPIMSGHIFDRTHSYTIAFEVFIALAIVGAAASFACRDLATEQACAAERAKGPAARAAAGMRH